MLWLAVHCPTLPLDCVLRRWPAGIEPALAITDLDGTRRFIAVVTPAAAAAGVRPGQAIATALALLPDLVLIPRDADDERRAIVEAALVALRFTPVVSLRPQGLVLEISASLKLFGGRRTLIRRLHAAIATQGLAIAIACAPTPHGAWLLALEAARRRVHDAARASTRAMNDATTRPASIETTIDAALDALPLVHLESARPYLHRFDGIGLRTLADLRRLPMKGLTRRFGPALTDEIARAFGDRPDPQPVFEAPSRFDARAELMARVESVDALVFVGERLIAQLAGWLAARRAAVRGFQLVLHHERWTRDAIPPTPVPIALATPSHDAERLVTLMKERLARIELKAPVHELSLEAPSIVTASETDGALFPTRDTATETLARLVEKLAARLGPDAMTRIERIADHRPERAWRERPAEVGDDAVDGSGSRGRSSGVARGRTNGRVPAVRRRAAGGHPTDDERRLPSHLGPRPAWLLHEPQVLDVRHDQPLFESLPLDRLAGPERIETGWWDDAPATRDYYIAENAAGRLVWIYRERLAVDGRELWFLHGMFG